MNPRLLPSANVARSVLRKQSDSRLTDLARAGSEPAFEAIVSRYRRSLVRYCASVVGDGDAEEVVQDALLKAHGALLRGDPVRRLSPWLHVVAYNTALSYLRARSSRPQAADADYDWCATMDSSSEHREELGEVLEAVRSLPDRQRDAIVMRELEGRSYDEIATRLGSSHGAVRQLLHRARSSVRERVAALLPLEPLVRWALTGAGGADVTGGVGLSGACVVGAKACAALLVPATIAVVAASPSLSTSPAPKPKPAVKARATVATSYLPRAAPQARMQRPAPASPRLATVTAFATRRVSVAPAHYARTRRLTADPQGARVSPRPSGVPQSEPATANQPQVQPPAQPAPRDESPPASAGQAVPLPTPQSGAGPAATPAAATPARAAPDAIQAR